MNDFAAADLSTVIDTEPRPSEAGAGVPTLTEERPEPKEPRSAREDLEHVFREDAKKQAAEKKPEPEKEEKPAVEAKEPAEKPAKAESEPAKAEEPAKPAETQEKAPEAKEEPKNEGRKIDPPSRFLPDAKEHWRNTPRSVQRDIENLVREHEADSQRHRETATRYESIRPFDELARQNGRDLRESLVRINQIENVMQRNPIAGLNAILQEIGPKKADGQAISLFEVAQHIVNQGQQGYQQIVAQGQPQMQQQPQQNPEVVQLKQQLAELEEKQIITSVIEPFKQAHPRFDELEGYIAHFLNSDIVPRSLSAPERLEAAYMMAERLAPSPQARETTEERPDPARRADDGFSGSKSIKSAPGSVSEDVEDTAAQGESIRDSILKAGRRLSR